MMLRNYQIIISIEENSIGLLLLKKDRWALLISGRNILSVVGSGWNVVDAGHKI